MRVTNVIHLGCPLPLTVTPVKSVQTLKVTPATFVSNKVLAAFYNVLSTNLDRKGREFVSTIEANKYPVWGTQWYRCSLVDDNL
jgi:hypothetical protein